jgi:hypothetical protein
MQATVKTIPPLTPDRKAAEQFLKRLDPTAKAFSFQVFHDSDGTHRGKVLHGTLEEHWQELCRFSACGYGVFVTINETNLAGRRLENITGIRAIWQECDKGDEPALPCAPHMTISTSPGKCHRYLLTDSTACEEFAAVQLRMVESYGSDPNAKDLARVLRVPGFLHQKDRASPHMVRITQMSDLPPLAWDAVKRLFPPVTRSESAKESKPFDKQSILDGVPEGDRDDTLFRYACSMQARGVTQAEAEILILKAAYDCKPRFDPKAAVEKVTRAYKQYGTPKAKGTIAQQAFGRRDLPAQAAAISESEWQTSRLAPDCVVEDYLYADVALLIAPGGTGKTTLMLYEAVHIALGRDLHGLEIKKRGRVVIVTAEDSREMLIARLRNVAAGMKLSDAHIRVVRDSVRIVDVSGLGLRLTTEGLSGSIQPSPYVDELITEFKPLEPVMVVIDPAISFGISEARINDNEQALVEAGRRMRRELNCCVRFIHHTGKANAREATADQYSGRGGSAFADGARMVHVLQPVKDSTTDLTLTRPKMSYCLPQDPLLLVRDGHIFTVTTRGPGDLLRRDSEYVAGLVAGADEPTKNTLEAMNSKIPRTRLREVIKHMIDIGALVYCESSKKGGAQEYLKLKVI